MITLSNKEKQKHIDETQNRGEITDKTYVVGEMKKALEMHGDS